MKLQGASLIVLALSALTAVGAGDDRPLLGPSVPLDKLDDVYGYNIQLASDFLYFRQKKEECLAIESQQTTVSAGRRDVANRGEKFYHQLDALKDSGRRTVNKRGNFFFPRQQIYILYRFAYREQELWLECLARIGATRTTTPSVVPRVSATTEGATSSTETATTVQSTTTVQSSSSRTDATVPTTVQTTDVTATSAPTSATTTVLSSTEATEPTTPVPSSETTAQSTETAATTVPTSATTADVSGREGTTVEPLEVLTEDMISGLVAISLTAEQLQANYIWISELMGRIIDRLTLCQTPPTAPTNANNKRRGVESNDDRLNNIGLVVIIIRDFYMAFDAQTELQECEAGTST